jgi:hypothetical protein
LRYSLVCSLIIYALIELALLANTCGLHAITFFGGNISIINLAMRKSAQ